MNIYDIAKKAEVSIATVSRVLNNSGYVGKATRNKILEVIEQSNYTPSRIAQNLSTNSTMKIIGIVCYNIEDLYYAKAVAVLERELSLLGYDIILSCTGESREQRQRSVDMLVAKNVDALIFIGSVFAGATEEVILNAAKYLPVFIINAFIKGKNIFCAYCDESEAITECVKRLYAEGRKKILFMYDVETYGSNMKLKGYKQGLIECRIPFDSQYCIKCNTGIEPAKAAFAEFASKNIIDAAISTNDVTSAGVLISAKELKFNIPKDLRVFGYNNSLIAKSLCMTSLENNVEKLAVFTAANLNKYFSGDEPLKKYKQDYELIVRET